MVKRWLPLEANPEVLNDFVSKIGFDTSKYAFCDIYGLDEELLAIVPQPVLATILLFPESEGAEAAKREEEERLQQQGQVESQAAYYMKQTIHNACGTIAVLHSVGNNLDRVKLEPGSILARFYEDSFTMTPEDRGRFLEDPPEGAPDIDKAHEAAARSGDTAAPNLEDEVTPHFVCLAINNGRLYEFDGCKSRPIDHGPSAPETLLQDSARVARKFMSVTNSVNFNLMALAPAQGDGW